MRIRCQVAFAWQPEVAGYLLCESFYGVGDCCRFG